MRHLRGVGEEDVLHHQVIEAAQKTDSATLVRLAARRVLADDVERAEVAAIHRLEHLAQMPPLPGWKGRATPGPRELVVDLRVFEVLETGQARRNRAHVAAALDVVLPAQRI